MTETSNNIIIRDEVVDNVHLRYTALRYFTMIEVGETIKLNGAKVLFKSSRTERNGDRIYTYRIRHHEDNWRVHVKVRTSDDVFTARIDRQFPADQPTHVAVTDWLRSVCA